MPQCLYLLTTSSSRPLKELQEPASLTFLEDICIPASHLYAYQALPNIEYRCDPLIPQTQLYFKSLNYFLFLTDHTHSFLLLPPISLPLYSARVMEPRISCILRILVWVTIVAKSRLSRANLEESFYTSMPQVIINGSQDGNSGSAGTWRQQLMQGPWEKCCLFPHSSWFNQPAFSQNPGLLVQGWHHPQWYGPFPINHCLTGLPHKPAVWRHFLI